MIKEIENIIKDNTATTTQKRQKLNEIEKNNPQSIFIKTNICSKCDNLDVEVWEKKDILIGKE